MKNQNDMIWSIVSISVALIVLLVCVFTRPEITQPPAPTPVNLTPAKLPEGDVIMADQLPGGGNNSGGGGAASNRGGGDPTGASAISGG